MERWQPPHRRRGRGSYASSNTSNYTTNTGRGSYASSNTSNYTTNTSKPTVRDSNYKANKKQENNDVESVPNLIGTCTLMCPVDERIQRERLRDLAVFERLDGNPTKSSSSLAVKKFCRTISTNDVRNADLRPVSVLEDTLTYLLTIFESSGHSFEAIHDFVFDRTRSIRQDLSMQNIMTGDQAIGIYERIVTFHIVSHYKLRRNNVKSDASPMHYLNMEQLTKTLSSLYHLYDQNRKSNPEFYSLYVLLNLGSDRQPTGESLSLWFRSLPYSVLKSKEMMFSRRLLRYFRFGNYKRFLRSVDTEASRLQYYVLEPYVCEVRAFGLSCLNNGGYKLTPYPLADVSKHLLLEESDVELFCKDCGLDTFTSDTGTKFMATKQTGFCYPKGSENYYTLVSQRLQKFHNDVT